MSTWSLAFLVLQGTMLRFTHAHYIHPRFNTNNNHKTTSGTRGHSGIFQSHPAFNNRADRPNKTQLWMSPLFVEFLKKAKDILPDGTDGETASNIAFHLMELETEKEKEILKAENEKEKVILKAENEKEKVILKVENEILKAVNAKELEMKLEVQKLEQKLRQSTAFHSKQLSAVVQRLVVLSAS